MKHGEIKRNAEEILKELPSGVLLVAACKTRVPEEIEEAVAGGVGIVGENYVQEAVKAFETIGNRVKWHFIGHLQKNKVKKAVEIFDLIETVDSLALAEEIDKRAKAINKIMPILIEINSGREQQKFGVFPENAESLIIEIARLSNVKIMGLMTMGELGGSSRTLRNCFSETKKLFDLIKAKNIPNAGMKYLSMGMSDSYNIAIEEGANLIRIGTRIFGERKMR